MRPWEQLAFDAALDGDVRGKRCPVCGDTSKGGSGPCSAECEASLEDRRDFAEEYARDAARGPDESGPWLGGDE